MPKNPKKPKPQEEPEVILTHHDFAFEEDEKNNTTREGDPRLNLVKETIFRNALKIMNASGIRYAVGASFARYAYTGIWRDTKDLDIFVKPEDLKATLDAFKEGGFYTEVTYNNWLAKARRGRYFIDIVFGVSNGRSQVTDASFEGSAEAEILGIKAPLFPIEEMINIAVYVAGRTRFDGAEIIHLIHGAKGKLDWQRILDALGEDQQLLLWYLIMFDFVYPGHPEYLPQDIMVQLFNESRQRWTHAPKDRKKFRGNLIDPFSFTVDTEDWGYESQRDLAPIVNDDGEML